MADDLTRAIARFAGAHRLDAHGVVALEALLRQAQAARAEAVGTNPSLPTVDLLGDPEDGALATMAPDGPPTHAAPPAPTPRAPTMGPRIATGGMAEIFAATDDALERPLAMKVLHPRLMSDGRMVARFLDEARLTAQLQHPAIPPVHHIGTLTDGRPYFTMKIVHGRTLADALRDAREDDSPGLRQHLVGILETVCEAVAYAHARGVVHCDLKPANVMVGAFGEVYVMDWGVARLSTPPLDVSSPEPPVRPAHAATTGPMVAGTPAYMPPEQAHRQTGRIGAAADVYALGVMLYEVLAGARPYRGSADEIREASEKGELPPLPGDRRSISDEALLSIVQRAMHPSPFGRYPHAGVLALELVRWREGATQREKALASVAQAEAVFPEVAPRLARARALRARAHALLAELGSDAPAGSKASAWALEDEAAEQERTADLRQIEAAQLLRTALAHAPDVREAHAALARLHFDQHEAAERRRDADLAARHELLLRLHDTGVYADYLSGLSELTLHTTAPAHAVLRRLETSQRRLVPADPEPLPELPLDRHALPIGSYVVELTADDGPTIAYPIVLRRLTGWSGRPPEARDPAPVWIPGPGDLRDDEVLVPAGWCTLGGDPAAPGSGPEGHVWVDGFAIQRLPVSCADFLAFLDAPEGAPWRGAVLSDAPDTWRAALPVVGMSWEAAKAYATWWSTQTDLAWRLPTEVEWEKAARGVDGRLFPWGDFGDRAFCNVRSIGEGSRRTRPTRHPADVSPYGVVGCGGNTRDWCADPWRPAGATAEADEDHPRSSRRVARGGSWRQPLEAARCAARVGLDPAHGHVDVGLRLVRTLP